MARAGGAIALCCYCYGDWGFDCSCWPGFFVLEWSSYLALAPLGRVGQHVNIWQYNQAAVYISYIEETLDMILLIL